MLNLFEELNGTKFGKQEQSGNELDSQVEDLDGKEVTTRKNEFSESQEEEENSEEDVGLIGGLVKTFLGGLSKVMLSKFLL